jgi:hypothetical protein
LEGKRPQETFDDCVVGPSEGKQPEMTDAERSKLAEMTRAMSRDEMLVVLENIPAELVIKRIELELTKARAFNNAICTALNIVKED